MIETVPSAATPCAEAGVGEPLVDGADFADGVAFEVARLDTDALADGGAAVDALADGGAAVEALADGEPLADGDGLAWGAANADAVSSIVAEPAVISSTPMTDSHGRPRMRPPHIYAK